MRRHGHRFGAVYHDGTGAATDQPENGFERGGSACTVSAQKRHHLALVHMQVDAVQDVRFAVPGMHVGEPKQFAP